MPYIDKSRREELAKEVVREAKTRGELNYLITLRMIEELNKRGKSYNNMNDIIGEMKDNYYSLDHIEKSKFQKDINSIKEWARITYTEKVGVIECAVLEFYRRVVAPYEDEAIKRNGDVY